MISQLSDLRRGLGSLFRFRHNYIIFGNVKISRNYLFDMPKFKEITYLRKLNYLFKKITTLDAKVFGMGLIFFMAPKFCTTMHHLKSLEHYFSSFLD